LFKAIDAAISHEQDEVQDRSKAVDAAISSASLVTLSSIIISVIVAVVFGLFFSRYISNPISNLKQASIQIGRGDYRTACKFLSKTHRGDEIGKLSSEIEKMRQSIESMKTNLDKLVEQRTKELEIKNQELFEREKDLERANQDLVRTEQAKEEFMSMVSHELKTPLTPLKMYSEMFLKTSALGKLDEKQKQVMRLMRNNVSKLEVLVNDIMDVYKLDIGKLRLSKQEIQASALLKENMDELQPIMQDKKIKFDSYITPPADKLSITCDTKRVGQVISNLVKNSVDFVSNTGGKITVKVAKSDIDDNSILFTIQDNGSWIPSEKVDNLFKSFYQIDTTATRKHGGTGLGLAICKGIIEGHGGKIWVDKEYV
jgi:signal transduction histidine kinase